MKPFPYPNPDNADLKEIELNIEASADPLMIKRLQAIRMMLLGFSPEDTALLSSCSRRTLLRWIHLYNESGIDALPRVRVSGRPSAVGKYFDQIVTELVQNPELVDREPWTMKVFHGYIQEQLQIKLGYSTLTRYLRELGFRSLVARPESPERDPEAREIFKEQLLKALEDPNQEVWFSDESGFLADSRTKRRLALKGTTPTTPQTGLHIRENVIGSINPQSGELVCLMYSSVDKVVFQHYLDYLSEVTGDRKFILVLDNASWHKASGLEWHNIVPMFLPPYSPDMNPIERLWREIKAKFFNHWYTKEREVLVERLSEALVYYMQNPVKVKSICKSKNKS